MLSLFFCGKTVLLRFFQYNLVTNVMFKRIISFLLLLSFSYASLAQHETIFLWKNIPSMKKERTRLYVFNNIPDSVRTGVGVIICPGGSYHHLGMRHEGYDVAKWLNTKGVVAFVLRYRVALNGYRYPAMIEDMQRAIQYVYDSSTSFGVNSNKIGVIGFSAGGHLATMAGSFHSTNLLKQHGITSSASLKPSFVVPIYPVVSMQDEIAHKRSRRSLLGWNFSPEMADSLSLELNIPNDMPPTLIIATLDDHVVNPQNSIELSKSLEAKQIPHKLVLFNRGGHGFGMGAHRRGDASGWNVRLIDWLKEINIL